MSYRYDSDIVILNRYALSDIQAKAELFETYDRLRDLTVSGPSMGGSGVGKFGSALVQMARMLGGAPFVPTFGSEAVNVPGTSYYAPATGGTGQVPGGQASFGLAPWSQVSGMPGGGAAMIGDSTITPLASFSSSGAGSLANTGLGFSGLGDPGFPSNEGTVGSIPNGSVPVNGVNGVIAGGAAPIDGASGILGAASDAGGLAVGTAAGAGFGRNWVMPAAGIVSGIGGLLTTLGPFFGPFGLAAAAGGSVLSGASGAILQSFQAVSSRILNNADTILTNKVKNLETTIKQLDAQQDIIRKLLKQSIDDDGKALDNL